MDIEKLVRDRTRVILAIGITFAIWQGGHILTQVVDAESSVFFYASIATIVGSITYTLAALALFMFYRRVKKVGAALTLADDWARLTRGLAIQYGFFFLFAAVAVFYAASMFWTLPVTPVLQSLILVGVTVTLLSFVSMQGGGV